MHNVYAITALIYASEKNYDVAYDYINLAISLSLLLEKIGIN